MKIIISKYLFYMEIYQNNILNEIITTHICSDIENSKQFSNTALYRVQYHFYCMMTHDIPCMQYHFQSEIKMQLYEAKCHIYSIMCLLCNFENKHVHNIHYFVILKYISILSKINVITHLG